MAGELIVRTKILPDININHKRQNCLLPCLTLLLHTMPTGPTVLPLCVPSWKTFFITFKSAYASNSGHTDKKKVNGSWRKVGEKWGKEVRNKLVIIVIFFTKLRKQNWLRNCSCHPLKIRNKKNPGWLGHLFEQQQVITVSSCCQPHNPSQVTEPVWSKADSSCVCVLPCCDRRLGKETSQQDYIHKFE